MVMGEVYESKIGSTVGMGLNLGFEGRGKGS